MLCPHHYIIKEGDEFKIASEFVSPPGMLAWQCQRCGRISHDEHKMDQGSKYWVKNPNELMERQKQIKKVAKKLGR